MIHQQDYNSDEYGAIATDMYQLFYIRTWPFPSCVMDSITGKNPNIAVGLFGPASDFALQGGSMAQFNITADLHKIAVPVLLTEGGYDYDIVRPVVVDVLEQNIPHTERITLSTTGHVSVVDAPGDMNNAMADFFGEWNPTYLFPNTIIRPVGRAYLVQPFGCTQSRWQFSLPLEWQLGGSGGQGTTTLTFPNAAG